MNRSRCGIFFKRAVLSLRMIKPHFEILYSVPVFRLTVENKRLTLWNTIFFNLSIVLNWKIRDNYRQRGVKKFTSPFHFYFPGEKKTTVTGNTPACRLLFFFPTGDFSLCSYGFITRFVARALKKIGERQNMTIFFFFFFPTGLTIKSAAFRTIISFVWFACTRLAQINFIQFCNQQYFRQNELN